MKRTERIRLYPTDRQTRRLRFMLDVTRDLYNSLLEERREAYRRRGISISKRQQYAELTALRAEDRRVASVYRECEDATLHRLDLAFKAFFGRVNRREAPGYPRFRSASRWNQIEFPHGNRALKLNVAQTKVSIPNIGTVRLRKGRVVPPFGRAWILRKNERWYACFEYERKAMQGPCNLKSLIGVDRGVHVLAATSQGVLIENRAFGEQNRTRVAHLQRKLELLTERDAAGRIRNRHDSKRKNAAQRLSRAKEREANQRRDYLNKAACHVVRDAGVVALEALSVRAMTRSARGNVERPGRNVHAKSALNRRILDASFGRLQCLIAKKVEETAKRLLLVDARFSSQECSHCGHVAKESRWKRRFCCVRCGYMNHADVNAALVIRRRAQLALSRMPHIGEKPFTQSNRVRHSLRGGCG